jgi:serine/threonine-protein kinase
MSPKSAPRHRFPALAAAAIALGACGEPAPAGDGGDGRLFPSSAPWYQEVQHLAAEATSNALISELDDNGGWGTGIFKVDFSMEVLQADQGTPMRAFVPRDGEFWQPDCDLMPVPVPAGGRLEGEAGYTCTRDGDCHLIVIQAARLYEMWRADIRPGAGGEMFGGGCLAVWDLRRDYWRGRQGYGRGEQCSSADAAGLPIAPLLLSADEVQAGEIKHALRLVLPEARIRKGSYVRPATHAPPDGGQRLHGGIPFGARLRLKSTYDLSRLSTPAARVVATALQRYGMILADAGEVPLTARSDIYTAAKWEGLLDESALAPLRARDFEVVDAGEPPIAATNGCRRTPL